jgi:transposase
MEHLIMSKKEREQLLVFEKLKKGEITQVEAAFKLEISTRWVRSKIQRYLEFGAAGLTHKNRGKISKKRWSETERELMLELLRSDWHGFGPTFTAEKLEELHNIKISKETIRSVIIEAGIWQPNKKKMKHRKRRERYPMTGLLIQLDGSFHDWFEGRAPWCTLLVFIDDATSKILWLEFVKSESYIGVMRATKDYIGKHGRPHAFYVDYGKVFSVNLNNPERDKKTQWERALGELSIQVIHAQSPQAKGRVERSNETMQDRLVKEMRLAKVSSIEEANKFLRESNFIAKHNELFAVSPAQEGDAHRPVELYNLENIFCLKEERILANDYTVLFNKRIFQLEAQQRTIIRPKDTIIINTHLNGSIRLSIRKTDLFYTEIHARPQKEISEPVIKQYKPFKPGINSIRWVSGKIPFQESRVKPASPAVEAK